MKMSVLFIAVFLSAQSFAQTVMGPEAREMFKVLTHNKVQECLQNVDLDMVDVKITKTVYRCPGCNTYTISGYGKNIDTPSSVQTIITLTGGQTRGAFGMRVQSYTCEITEK